MKRTILFLILALMLCAALVVGVNAEDNASYTLTDAEGVFEFQGYSAILENGVATITCGYKVVGDIEALFGKGSNLKYGVVGAFVTDDGGAPLKLSDGKVVAAYESDNEKLPAKIITMSTSYKDGESGNVFVVMNVNANLVGVNSELYFRDFFLSLYVADGNSIKYLTGDTLTDKPEAISYADLAQGLISKDATINVNSGEKVTLGDLFALSDNVTLDELDETVIITTTVNGQTNTLEISKNDFASYELELLGVGEWTIEVKGNNRYHLPATAKVTVNPCDQLTVKFPNVDKYLYRVGNVNTVSLNSLFQLTGKQVKGAQAVNGTLRINGVEIEIKTVKGNATGTYTANTTWTNGIIQFTGTGIVSVNASCSCGCREATSLELEVVNAVNATSATSAKSNNVVLLNDVGFSTIEVSGGYTLYGNGFKMTATSDPMYDTMNAGFVVLKNGTLDNLQIICPDLPYAILYQKNILDDANPGKPNDLSNNARGNVRSAIMADGNSKILNSYVRGGRAAIFLRSGHLLVDNTTVHGGAAANIHVLSPQSLTLRDATLIQEPLQADVYDTTKMVMGFSVLVECDSSGAAAPIYIEGTLIQNAWVNESYKKYVPSDAATIVNNALSKTEYLHDLDGDGTKESLNLGFAYIPQDLGGATNSNAIDNRFDKASVPYDSVSVGNSLASATIYSYKNSNGTNDDFIFSSGDGYESEPDSQMSTPPTLTYTDINEDRVFNTSYDANDGRWESTLTVNLDKGNYTFSFGKLLAQKYGKNLSYTINGSNMSDIALTTSGVTEYKIVVTDSNDTTHTLYFILIATKTSIPEPEVSDTTGGTPLLVVKSKNSDWSCAIPALDGIKIKYYTADGEILLNLATLTPSTTGKQNGTKNYWETTKDGYTLKVTCGYIHDTKQVYGMPVVVNNGGNKMYFTISSTNGYVSTNTSGRTVTLTYEFTDPNGKTLTFSKTWQFNYADYKNGKQYSYSDFVNGTLKEAGSGGCVTPDTLVTLADGTQKEIQYVTANDSFLVYDFVKGEYSFAPASIIMNHGYDEYTVTTLNFDDGTVVNTINGHGFYDVEAQSFVILSDENVQNYIGKSFVKADGSTAVLASYSIELQYVESWSLLTAGTYNCVLNGMLTLTPAEVDGSPLYLMPYEIGNDMKYDQEKMQADIEKYGLYTYDDFKGLVTYEQFVAFGFENFKVSVGKGYITWDEILFLLSIHVG